LLYGVAAVSDSYDVNSDPYAFKCNNETDSEGKINCENEGLGESIRLLATDYNAISTIAKPFDL